MYAYVQLVGDKRVYQNPRQGLTINDKRLLLKFRIRILKILKFRIRILNKSSDVNSNYADFESTAIKRVNKSTKTEVNELGWVGWDCESNKNNR